MKFGVNILNYGPGATPETLQGWARFAEEIGYHLVMISDHVAITPDVQGQFPVPFWDPFVALGWLAGATTRVELGTTVVILPYRHPLLTARMATNLDQICGGRFILGVGIGWAAQEFAALDVPFARRGDLSDEYLEVILAYLTNDLISYQGEFVAFENVYTAPRSVQSPRLPVWIGGKTPPALRRAVTYGDSWHPYQIRVDWLRDTAMPKLRQLAEAAEKPTPKLCPRITLHITERPMPEETRMAGKGTLDQVRRDLEGLALLDAEYVLLDTFIGHADDRLLHPEDDWAMLARLAEDVLDLERQTLRNA